MSFFGYIASFLTFAALVLQVFSMIGTTSNRVFLRDLYFAKLTIGQEVFIAGLWGYCTGSNGISSCSKPKAAFEWTEISQVGSFLSGVPEKIFLANFILYWIALGLTFIALVITVWSHYRRGPDLLASLLTFAAFVVQMTVFVILLVISIKGVNAAKKSSSNVSGQLGTSMWMTLGAFVALFLASFSYCFACICGSSRKSRPIEKV